MGTWGEPVKSGLDSTKRTLDSGFHVFHIPEMPGEALRTRFIFYKSLVVIQRGMKRKRGECQPSSRLFPIIEILRQTKEFDQITCTFVCTLQRLLDTDKTIIELLTSDHVIQSLSSISSVALSALLLALMRFVTGRGEKCCFDTNVQVSIHETLSPYQTTPASTLNNSLSVLKFIKKIVCLRYNISNYTSDAFQLWLSASSVDVPNNKTWNDHITCENQKWVPRITFMLAYSCLINRIQIVNKTVKSEAKLDRSEVLCTLKNDHVILSSILLLSYSTIISRMMNTKEQEGVIQVFHKHISHTNDFVNAMVEASKSKSHDDYETSMESNTTTTASKTTFETLLEEVRNCKDLEDNIHELNDTDKELSANYGSECEVANNGVEAEDSQPEVSANENAAIELLPILAEIPTTNREVDFATSKVTSLLLDAGKIDGAEGIRKVAMVFSERENPVKFSDELIFSLCKSCITEEISVIRASAIMESFVLPSILRIGGDDTSGPPSRLLATTVSGLLKTRPLETVTSLFVPTINQKGDDKQQLPNKMQLDFVNRTIKSVPLTSDIATIMISPLISMIWSEESIVLLHTVLQKVSDDQLSNDTKSKLMDKIVITSTDAGYVKSAKFASLFQTFVKRHGNTLSKTQIQSLLEACENLKSMTAKAISTTLRKLA